MQRSSIVFLEYDAADGHVVVVAVGIGVEEEVRVQAGAAFRAQFPGPQAAVAGAADHEVTGGVVALEGKLRGLRTEECPVATYETVHFGGAVIGEIGSAKVQGGVVVGAAVDGVEGAHLGRGVHHHVVVLAQHDA